MLSFIDKARKFRILSEEMIMQNGEPTLTSEVTTVLQKPLGLTEVATLSFENGTQWTFKLHTEYGIGSYELIR